MWTARQILDDRQLKATIELDGSPISYADVLRCWQTDAEVRTLFMDLLAKAPFSAFRWVTPPITSIRHHLQRRSAKCEHVRVCGRFGMATSRGHPVQCSFVVRVHCYGGAERDELIQVLLRLSDGFSSEICYHHERLAQDMMR
jgi:hypothetical protein